MDPSGYKNGTTEDKTSDEPPRDNIYFNNVIPILVQNVQDHHMAKKITIELEMERLAREHERADKIIAAQLEKIKKQNERSAELDRQIYNATQLENQTKTRIERTGEIFHALKDEAANITIGAEKIEVRRLEITKKLQDCAEQQQKNEEKQEKIANLERQIKELLDAPEPTLNENVVKTNEELRKRLQQTKAKFEMRRKKKIQIAEMKEQKLNLLMKISERQQQNATKREEIKKDAAERKKIEEEMKLKCDGMKTKISTAIEKKNELTQELTESIKRTEGKKLKVEEQEKSIGQKEIELENLKKKCTNQQEFIRAENERKQKEYESEKDKLVNIEQKLQFKLDEKAKNLIVLNEKTQKLTNLKTEKEQLTGKVYEQKIQLLTRQFENRHQQLGVDLLAEKLSSEQNQVNQLKSFNDELEKRREEIQQQLEKCPQEFEEKRRQMESKYKEKIEMIVKQKNFKIANTEFVQIRLDKASEEAEKLEREIKDLEQKNDWLEIKYVRKQTSLIAIEKNSKKEQQAFDRLLKKSKQIAAQNLETNEAEEMSDDVEPIENILGAISINKSPLKVIGNLDLMEASKNDNTQDTLPTSGRKSPGILKKDQEQKRPRTPTRRVTFCGLSSTESASSSEPKEKKSKSLEEKGIINDLLEDYSTSTARRGGKRNPIDF